MEVFCILYMTRYAIKNERLTPWVKFLWQFDAVNADLHYKLLPTDCIDIILNLADDMVYETEAGRIDAPPFHINGLRSNHSFIHQKKTIRIFGISFYPFGLYPFVHQSLQGLQNEVFNLYGLSFSLAQGLRKASANNTSERIVAEIENALLDELSVNRDFAEKARLIRDFMALNGSVSVKSFCSKQAISIKTFERMFLYYTGFTPKVLSCVRRFQNASNQLAHQHLASFTDITYDNRFADQSHFIKEFTRFSGTAPHAFQAAKNTVKENVKYTYL